MKISPLFSAFSTGLNKAALRYGCRRFSGGVMADDVLLAPAIAMFGASAALTVTFLSPLYKAVEY
ncbi:MAG TPA: hypothetical protein ENJ64_02210 [Thiotrichales bacterium]|nr:hypothetical protein [Thiotrichales bacterium]